MKITHKNKAIKASANVSTNALYNEMREEIWQFTSTLLSKEYEKYGITEEAPYIEGYFDIDEAEDTLTKALIDYLEVQIEYGVKINASTKSKRKAVKSSMNHKRRYIKSDIDIWDDLGFSDFDDIDWAELFGLESEEVFYDSVRQYLGMNPDDDVEFVDIVEYVNNHPKYYNILKKAYYNGFDNIGASTRRRPVTATTEYTSPNADVIAVLEDNGFEYSYEPTPWWDKYMWLGFGATYNDETEQAYVWWNPNGNAYELPFNYSVETVSDAKAMCDDLYTWDDYDIAELLNAGLPLIGATPYNNKLDEWEYDNGMGDKAYINTDLGNGYVIDAYGEKTEYSNLQDLLEAASIIR